jgi:hypothetical protein
LKRGQNIKYLPHAFTEHGAIMAATVLNSPEAVAMSVFVVRAFMQMREQLAANAAILKRLAEIAKPCCNMIWRCSPSGQNCNPSWHPHPNHQNDASASSPTIHRGGRLRPTH